MELSYNPQNFNSSEILHSAQTIADAFAESLKQNNCMLMLTVSLHQEINDAIKDVVDLGRIEESEWSPDDPNIDFDDVFTDDLVDSLIASVNDSKSRCYSCTLTLPFVKFDGSLDSALGKLSALLSVFNNLFNVGKLDLCQPGYAMRNSCLPDILKLIVLLITAYIAIMTLKNIQSISVLAFIKGVISTLLEKIFSAVKLSISIGGTNTACIIEALREIAATLVPTQEQIMASLDSQAVSGLQRKEITAKTIREENEARANGTYVQEDALSEDQKYDVNAAISNSYIASVHDGIGRVDTELAKINNTVKTFERNLNETFDVVVDTLDESMEEINSYISNLLAFKSTFECEGKRSGTDISEVIMQVNRLIQVLNLLSAVALSIAQKEAVDRICSTQGTIRDLTDPSVPNVEDVQMKDVVEEYYGKEAEIIEDEDSGIQVIIHDKPKEQLLPKLDLFMCSIDDFIDSHKIENVIKVAEDNVRKNFDNYIRKPVKDVDKDIPRIGDSIYVLKKPGPDQLTNIDNIVNILYEDPGIKNKPTGTIPEEIEVPVDIVNMIGTQGVSNIFKENNTNNSTLNCRSIDDVMSVLDQLRSKL